MVPGFTLLEILVAMVVLAMLLSALFGSFNALLTSAGHIEHSVERFEAANDCMRRMIGDLNALRVNLPPSYQKPQLNSDPDPYRVVGESGGGGMLSRLRFASLAHFPMAQEKEQGLAEIEYVAQENGDGLMTIRRKDRLLAAADSGSRPASPLSAPVICDQLKDATFSYLDQEGEARERWDSEAATFGYATPAAVRIKLVFAGYNGLQPMETMVTLPARREKID